MSCVPVSFLLKNGKPSALTVEEVSKAIEIGKNWAGCMNSPLVEFADILTIPVCDENTLFCEEKLRRALTIFRRLVVENNQYLKRELMEMDVFDGSMSMYKEGNMEEYQVKLIMTIKVHLNMVDWLNGAFSLDTNSNRDYPTSMFLKYWVVRNLILLTQEIFYKDLPIQRHTRFMKVLYDKAKQLSVDVRRKANGIPKKNIAIKMMEKARYQLYKTIALYEDWEFFDKMVA